MADSKLDRRIIQRLIQIASEVQITEELPKLMRINIATNLISVATQLRESSPQESERLLRIANKLSSI